MKFNKIIIDGKEYYEKVEEEKKKEVRSAPRSSDCEIEENCDCEELSQKEGCDFFEKLGTGAKELGEKLVAGAKDLGVKIKSGTEKLFGRERLIDLETTEGKLLRLLPYMSREDAHGVALKLMENEKILKNLNLSVIFQYFCTADCDMLFIRSIEAGNMEYDLKKLRSYISDDCLTLIVEGYITGKYEYIDIDGFYPYIKDEDIRRIFVHILESEKKSNNGDDSGDGDAKT